MERIKIQIHQRNRRKGRKKKMLYNGNGLIWFEMLFQAIKRRKMKEMIHANETTIGDCWMNYWIEWREKKQNEQFDLNCIQITRTSAGQSIAHAHPTENTSKQQQNQNMKNEVEDEDRCVL